MKIISSIILKIFFLLCVITIDAYVIGQTAMTNIYGRSYFSLNGKWDAIIDQASEGKMRGVFKNAKPLKNTEFLEYSFDGLQLDVPGDFNSQLTELKYYEGSIWYKKDFVLTKKEDKRYFIYFGAVNYIADVYLNGKLLGSHEGGFFPFQFEITNLVKSGENFFVVQVNNTRKEDGIPGLRYDWWNYGGITRDVLLVETPKTYIHDYTVQLKKRSRNVIEARIELRDIESPEKITIEIPEVKVHKVLMTDSFGVAHSEINAKFQLWNPQNPKLYDIIITTPHEQIKEKIGFRSIETKGNSILLNGEPVFLKGINIHDEIPMRGGRAYSEADAALLLREAKKLGCNFVRFAHLPPFEPMVKMAEEMGMMIWLEIPVWQRITFDNPKTVKTGEQMIHEMIARDKNRCGVILWSVANETRPSSERNKALTGYINLCRTLDDTRLITAAFNNMKYDSEQGMLTLEDSIADMLDIVSINKYFGWYNPWPLDPEKIQIKIAADRPLIYSEFGCEALYGHDGDPDVASSWGELYQKKLYTDHTKLFNNIPNLCGVAPWVLFDLRSPSRMHQQYQKGWNRKGLISDKGFYKKAWQVVFEYYKKKDTERLR
ncbi:MAG: glycoside hydrolase family 2 TIM barrel-domain containing protein [Paludibacter sp.]|nr:glycoside hydrolase family 2 TIM barrel-domain containing protein [Paludibacter sp.]